jgi:hypothetical protein
MVYDFSPTGEFSRDFGLRDQMRRAAVSVMSNIAEGFESRTRLCSSSIWDAPELPLVSCAPNFIWCLIEIASPMPK